MLVGRIALSGSLAEELPEERCSRSADEGCKLVLTRRRVRTWAVSHEGIFPQKRSPQNAGSMARCETVAMGPENMEPTSEASLDGVPVPPTREQQDRWAAGVFDAGYRSWRSAIERAAPGLPPHVVGRVCLIHSNSTSLRKLRSPIPALGGRTLSEAAREGDLEMVSRVLDPWEEYGRTSRVRG